MSGMVEKVTGRALKDDTGSFQGVSPAGDRSAICDAMVNAYAGDLRHVRFVVGLARHLAVRDVDNMIAASGVPEAYQAILKEQGRAPESAVPRDRLDEAAVDGFVAELGDHLRNPDIARNLLPLPHQPGQQSSPMRAAARALFLDSADARAQIPTEQHENAIIGIQQAMEAHYRLVDGAANGLVGHSGLSPRALEQTLLEARLLGGEVAGIGIEAVEMLAHPPAPAADQLQAAFVDASAAQRAATFGVTPATGTPVTTTVPTAPAVHRDPREAYRYDPPGRS
ncbi:hypothetical protein EV646_106252 [Kribbella antiqua]|uniref:Uncharacterized protein n=1 Tax=Kribbella antiqua TaxID=2512217 RepID=A0A4R2IPA6_9ACTN|nr:hypothetical protein [Kribbella antiqua]TCO47013.1 hypothetical protein EV646_106252 [Kribbella antiqua]